MLGVALDAAPRSFVLMIDDVHHVVGAAGLELLDGLVDHVPTGSVMVLGGRVEPSFVAQRRVRSEVHEVGARELALAPRDAVHMFAAAGVTISASQAAEVVERTEGWAAGVYLSALLARDDPDSWSAVPLSGSSRYVTDYLLQQAFAALDEDVQEFLLGAAVLEQMSGELCDHVLGATSSQRMLQDLEHQNLFVVPLDDTRDWFRFHALYREFLLGELRRRRPAEERIALERRAVDWCRTHGRTEQAIELLLRAQDVDALGPLLMSAMRGAYLDGRSGTVDRWLATAGPVVIERFPPLAVLAGWFTAATGRPADAERWAAMSEGLTFDGVVDDGWASYESSTASFRALICADGPEAMCRDAELSVRLEPQWSPWRNCVLWLLGEARELLGDRAGAIEAYDEAMRLEAAGTHRPILVVTVSRALVAMDSGDWATAEVNLRSAARIGEVMSLTTYAPLALAHAAAARFAQHHDDQRAVDEHVPKAMAARGLLTHVAPFMSVRLRLVLADVHARRGDRSTAAMLLDEADRIVAVRPRIGVRVDELAALRLQQTSGLAGNVALTAAERRIVPFLPTHLTFAEIGEQLYISRHTVHTHVGSIYRKLAVTSRSAAVQRAEEMGFLQGGSSRSNAPSVS